MGLSKSPCAAAGGQKDLQQLRACKGEKPPDGENWWRAGRGSKARIQRIWGAIGTCGSAPRRALNNSGTASSWPSCRRRCTAKQLLTEHRTSARAWDGEKTAARPRGKPFS
jgi:hypothetical protein